MDWSQICQESLGLTREDYTKALASVQGGSSFSWLQALESLNLVKEDLLLEVLAKHYRVPRVHLNGILIAPAVIALVPRDLAHRYRVIPVEKTAHHSLVVAIGDPLNEKALEALREKCHCPIKPVLALESEIKQYLDKFYKEVEKKVPDNHNHSQRLHISNEKTEGPAVKVVNDLLTQCIQEGASDIHFEPYENFTRVRLRIDGILKEILKVPQNMKAALVSRIKIMAGLNIAETRLPQDGGINIFIDHKAIDFRVSTLPTFYGEKIVMRALDKENLQVDMKQLGFESAQLNMFLESIRKPHGMVLVTGPTGSGKTTTLYSALQELNKIDTNIVTAEDPVEYNLEGINQVQVRGDIGLTFASALKAFLRQDPNIIMVGEIRDLETAEIAIKAALTGHLVLSTLHTNSASETLSRLLSMGVASFNLASALKCVTAQRLVRRVCPQCSSQEIPSSDAMISLGVHPDYVSQMKIHRGLGCSHCYHTGLKGRLAIHEVMTIKEPIKQAILKGFAAMDIKKIAMDHGMISLRQAALTKMARGETIPEEVARSSELDQ